MTHRTEAELKFVQLRKDGIYEDWLFGVSRKV